MNKIVLILVSLLLGGVISYFIFRSTYDTDYEKLIQQQQDSIIMLQDLYKLDSLKIDSLQEQVYIKDTLLLNKKINIVYVEKKYDSFRDSIIELDINGSIEFLTSWLSKNDTI